MESLSKRNIELIKPSVPKGISVTRDVNLNVLLDRTEMKLASPANIARDFAQRDITVMLDRPNRKNVQEIRMQHQEIKYVYPATTHLRPIVRDVRIVDYAVVSNYTP